MFKSCQYFFFQVLVLVHSGTDFLQDPALDLDGVCLVLPFLDGVELLSVLEVVLFQEDHLAIQVFFNVLVVLDESCIGLCTHILHSSLMVGHHLLEVVSKFSIGLVEGQLDSLLQS